MGTLVPTIGLVQVSLQARADRYMYIPLIGLAIAVSWSAVDVFGATRRGRCALLVAALAACAALATASYGQVQYWKDSLTLFERARAVTERNYFAHNGIGFAHLESTSPDRLERAEAHFREATRIEPRWALPHRGLAIALVEQDDLVGAIAELRAFLDIEPNDQSAYESLGTVLARAERYTEALTVLERALELGGDSALLRARLGTAAARAGRFPEARTHLTEALRQRPDWSQIATQLAELSAVEGPLNDAASKN